MAPNVTLHFFPANDVNGDVLHEITDEDSYFRGLALYPERDGLGKAELLLARRVGFAGFGTGTFFPEVFVRAIVHAYSDTSYYPWGFFLTKRQQVVIARMEDGEEVFKFGGPGPKQYLDRGVLGIGSPDTGWNLDLANGVWRWTDAATIGRILGRIINQDSTEDDPALPDLTVTFDDSDDSASAAWADTDISGPDDQYQIPIGTSLLQALWDLDDIVELDSWVDLGTVASPKFELNVRQGLGADKTGSAFGSGVCLLKEGENIANDSLEVEGASVKKASHVIVEGANGKWAEAIRPSFSPGDYVKRDKIEYTRSQSVYWLEKAGLRWLKRQDYGERELTVEIVPGASDATGLYFPAPDRNLWLSNLISVDTSADGTTHTPLDINASEDQLVTGLELTLGPAGDTASATAKARSWDVKVHLNRERPSTIAKAPDQRSASSGGPGPRCCSPFPHECPPTPGDTLLTDSDDSGWLGTLTGPDTDGFTGMWRSVGGSGGTSMPAATVSGLSPGDYSITVRLGGSEHKYTGTIQVRDSTAVNPPIDITFPNAVRAPGGHGSVTGYSAAFELPTGYDRIRYFHASKMGGWRYQGEIYALAAPPAPGEECIPEGTGGDPTDPLYPFVPHYNDPRFGYGEEALDLIGRYFHEDTVDPTATDDDTIGFLVGSIWVNTASDEAFVATDVSTGAANWESATAGGGGGAPTTADYLVGTAQGGLSAEIVVGTTPGGELGGTWASPTVDSTHSGSAHHTESHQSRHNTGGADALKLDDLAAPDDNTDLNASTSAHGLLKKLPGGTTDYLRADGSFADPIGGGGLVPTSWTNWTPTITQGASVTCTVTYARYIKMGAITFFRALLLVTSNGTTNNPIVIGGQPTDLQDQDLAAGLGAQFGAIIGVGRVFDEGQDYMMVDVHAAGATDWRLIPNNSGTGWGSNPNRALSSANSDRLEFSGFIRNA
jgi:hypothetical protein